MKIAFHVLGSAGWIAGPNYVRGLFVALRERFGNELGLYLLAPEKQNGAADFSRAVRADALLEYRTHRPWTAPWALDRAAQCLLARDLAKENVLRAMGIQVLFGMQLAFESPKLATLSLIPDFQHVHLPEMFSAAELEYRDQVYAATARRATRVIVLCETVRKDFAAFAPPSEATRASTHREVFTATVAPGHDAGVLLFDIEANAFLQRMVRRIVAALVEVGQGKLSQAEFRRLVEEAKPGAAAATAPARGLCLMKVRYESGLFDAETDEDI